MVSGAPREPRAAPTPETFRSGQTDLLKQAADVEAFLARRQAAGVQQQARSAWLLAHQELEHEAAVAVAQLLDWLSGATAQPSLLQQLLLPEEGAHSAADGAPQHGGPSAAAKAVGEAAALAGEAARLLHSQSPAPTLTSMQQRMASALACLQAEVASLQDTAGGLLADIQRVQRQAAARSPSEVSLQERVAQLCAAHPLAPASCVAHLHAEAAELEAKHAQQRQERRAAWRAFLAATRRQAGGSSWPEPAESAADAWVDEIPSCTGEASSARSSSSGGDSASWQGTESYAGGTADGWAAEEHAVFMAARKTAGAAGPAAASALVRQLAALLPARSADQVAAHEGWHREASRLQSAAQQGEAGARQEAAAFLAAAAALLATAEAQCLEQAGAALQQLEAAAASLQAGECLQQQREQRAQAVAASDVARFQAAAAAAAQQAERCRQQLEWRDQMKLLVAQHRERQAAEDAAAAAAEQAAAAAAAREAAAAAAQGRQRVACRAAQAEAKRACRAQQEASRQQERDRRRAALEALASSVAPAVPRNAARATGPTESSAAAAGVEQQRHGLFAQALGFTTDQLLADQRFKVYEALRQLGLHNSAAGRQAVVGARPAGAVRADMLTSAQRQGLRRQG